jgi:hypothetical protein
MNILITVQGHHHSKKSYLIAFIKRYLESHGVNVYTQDFHLKDKPLLTDEEIISKIKGMDVTIMEQDT